MLVLIFAGYIGAVFSQTCQTTLPNGGPFSDAAKFRYDNIDTNADGAITTGEYESMSQREDANSDGCTTYQEFHNHYPGSMLSNYTRQMYDAYDADRDNCLTVTEMNNDLLTMDTNHDGSVQKSEWVYGYSKFLYSVFCPMGIIG